MGYLEEPRLFDQEELVWFLEIWKKIQLKTQIEPGLL